MKEDTQHNMTHHLDIFRSTHAGIFKQNIAKTNFKHLIQHFVNEFPLPLIALKRIKMGHVTLL